MKKAQTKQNFYAMLAALIWGTAFVAQSIAADSVPALEFTSARSGVAVIFLTILCLIRGFHRKKIGLPMRVTPKGKNLVKGGILCGTALMAAASLQQKGIETTTVGKASFITTLYIVLVPLFGILLKKKPPKIIWLCVALAVAGLYCLCMTESFTIAPGDIFVLLCAFCFTTQILLIDHFTQSVDGIELSCVQFATVTVLTGIGSLLFENPTLSALSTAVFPVLYVGIFSSGIAYTLQILAQKDSEPAVISLLLSLESVFGTLGAAIILKEHLSAKEYIGCLLMMTAVILAQLPDHQEKK